MRKPMTNTTRGQPLHESILEHCSPGPWHHGLRVPPFSADSQPCVYGDERELPLAMLDDTDQEASANVVLMAAAFPQEIHHAAFATNPFLRLLGRSVRADTSWSWMSTRGTSST